MKKNLVVLLLLSVLTLSGCANTAAPKDSSTTPDPIENEENDAPSDSAPADTAQPEDTNDEDSETEAVLQLLQIGEEGVLGDWAVTVTNAQITDSIKESDYYGFKPEEGNKYLAIDISAVNNGKNAATFLPSVGFGTDLSAKVIFQQEYEYSSSVMLGYSNDMHNTSINPLSAKTGTIVFELPDSVASSEEELILKFTEDNNELTFKVK